MIMQMLHMNNRKGIYGGKFIIDRKEERITKLEREVKRINNRLRYYEGDM